MTVRWLCRRNFTYFLPASTHYLIWIRQSGKSGHTADQPCDGARGAAVQSCGTLLAASAAATSPSASLRANSIASADVFDSIRVYIDRIHRNDLISDSCVEDRIQWGVITVCWHLCPCRFASVRSKRQRPKSQWNSFLCNIGRHPSCAVRTVASI